ncbi:DUF2974 domain-containing protein [Bifidobacterium platyrrhinorum]|uniref:DUF2974 domain-containing protein n=1 Tax=Bifidobacterium platyrrhinorum TaxID=2661628 RepID=A0A6L9SSF2_9BIFI|nr:DUF2974 domain-containing protein [Bifidobacterium platyrrhinorum]NEG55527.1 DUF2974 domain-containing protein [Bifidobacterium platyrrhinorum]
MGNVTDDLRTRFDTFDDDAFNEVDSLVLSQLAYARMPGNVPRWHGGGGGVPDHGIHVGDRACGETGRRSLIPMVPIRDLLRAECYDAMFGRVWSPQLNVDLLRAMCESPRWRALRVGGYVDEFDAASTKQFSACVFDVGEGTLYVAFRGTDSSIIGWKEDFAMAFRRPVASQSAAVRYLADAAARWDGPLMVGGHSKGGNLAVYAAAAMPDDIAARIAAVYSHDGPGFDESFLESTEYRRVAGKVRKSVPESSVIGMLFENRERADAGYEVVASDGLGIMQHFALNWQVKDGRFVHADGLSGGARYAARTLNDWMARYDDDRRRLFIENLFAILEASGYRTFGELTAHWTQSLPAMLAALRGIDAEDREVIAAVLKGLAATAATAAIPGAGPGESASRRR